MIDRHGHVVIGTLSAMICPKCQNAMHTFDKSGVHIDQCEDCHGIFLDRGELNQIVNAENSFYGGAGQQPQYGRPDSPRPYRGGYADSPRGHRGGFADSPRPHGGHHGHKRRKSFLEQLFD